MLGKLIPAGTGMKRYRSVKLDSEELELQNDDVLDFGEEAEDADFTDDQNMEAGSEEDTAEDEVTVAVTETTEDGSDSEE